MSKTTYKYWVAGVRTSSPSIPGPLPSWFFNEEIETNLEVKTADDITEIVELVKTKLLINRGSLHAHVYLTSWPHLLGITRDGQYRPYVTMVKID